MTVHVKTADEATLEHVQEATQLLGRAAAALGRAIYEQRATSIAALLSDLGEELDGIAQGVAEIMAHLQKQVKA